MPRYHETTGFIIHNRNFKDSSLIIEFFSKDYGKISLIAKGIKKNKKLKSQLQYFSLLKIQYFGKSQLKTLSAINILISTKFEPLIEKTTALYLNELLRYSLIDNDPAHRLFDCYQASLINIGKIKLTPLLRQFENEILIYNGFELNLKSFNNTKIWLTINETEGLVATNTESEMLCLYTDLMDFLDNTKLDKIAQKRLNRLMYHAINVSLMNRKLYARSMLIELTKKAE